MNPVQYDLDTVEIKYSGHKGLVMAIKSFMGIDE